jgi:hypothetical protein
MRAGRLPMIFIDVARYLRRTWPELFVVEPGFAGLHRRIDPFARDSPLEGSGFELSVPLRRRPLLNSRSLPRSTQLGHACRGSAQAYPLSGWRRVLRSCCPHLAPCAAPFGPSDRVQRSPALHNNAPSRPAKYREHDVTLLDFATLRSLPLSLWTSHWDRYLTVTRLAGCGV